MVRDIVGKSGVKLVCHLGSRHLCGAFRHINDALVDLLHLPRLWCADKIVDSAVSLDNVRGDSSYITVRVVDSRVGDNVLPQVVDPDAHELRSVQCGTSKFRGCCRVGSHTLKVEEHADIRQCRLGPDRILIARMPCKSSIHTVKYTFSCHDCLSVSLFLTRATKKDHSSRFRVLLDISFYSKRCRHSTRTEEVMSASMSIRVVPCGFLSHRAAAFLGQLRQGVILGEETDHRLSASVYSLERRRHTADSHLHLESLFFQDFLVELRGLEFMESDLCVVENFVADINDQSFFICNCF